MVARMVRVHEAVGSTPATRTMRSVLIGFEYPVTDTPHFYFSQSSYCNLCRGVADCYAFSRFHDNVGLRDLPVIRHIESADAVVVDLDTLIGFPVSGSMPAVYRPSQRPSFRLRMLPSPFARFFAIYVPLSVLVTQTTVQSGVSWKKSFPEPSRERTFNAVQRNRAAKKRRQSRPNSFAGSV